MSPREQGAGGRVLRQAAWQTTNRGMIDTLLECDHMMGCAQKHLLMMHDDLIMMQTLLFATHL